MGRIRLVLFDIDGTLIDHDRAVATGIAALGSAPEAPPWMRGRRFADPFRLGCDEIYRDYLGWEGVPIKAQRDLLRSFDRSLSLKSCDSLFRTFIGGYYAGIAVCADVPGALFRLHGNVQMGVLAHGHPPTEHERLKRLGLMGLFDSIDILAEPLDGAAPVDEIIRRYGLPCEEIAFVSSDLSRSALPLSRLAVSSMWLNRRGWGEHATVPMIRSLDQLPPLLSEEATASRPPLR